MCVGNLPRVVAWWCAGWMLNLWPLDHESDTLTTTPPSQLWYTSWLLQKNIRVILKTIYWTRIIQSLSVYYRLISRSCKPCRMTSVSTSSNHCQCNVATEVPVKLPTERTRLNDVVSQLIRAMLMVMNGRGALTGQVMMPQPPNLPHQLCFHRIRR